MRSFALFRFALQHYISSSPPPALVTKLPSSPFQHMFFFWDLQDVMENFGVTRQRGKMPRVSHVMMMSRYSTLLCVRLEGHTNSAIKAC